jgi:uncharacterized membrane protein
MSDEVQDERRNAVELLRLRDELDALDQIVPLKEAFRFSVVGLFLFLLLWVGVGALAYVPYAFVVIIAGGLVVYERKVRRARLLRERESIQSQIRQIEDAP